MNLYKYSRFFDDWVEINSHELDLVASESGADRELDFDLDAFQIEQHEIFLKSCRFLHFKNVLGDNFIDLESDSKINGWVRLVRVSENDDHCTIGPTSIENIDVSAIPITEERFKEALFEIQSYFAEKYKLYE